MKGKYGMLGAVCRGDITSSFMSCVLHLGESGSEQSEAFSAEGQPGGLREQEECGPLEEETEAL